MKQAPVKPFRTGFTLIELLVVIAILALLVAVLMPSLNKAKELARQAVCVSNLRNCYLAFASYYEDNREWICGNDLSQWYDWKDFRTPTTGWQFVGTGKRLAPYIGSPLVFWCPDDVSEGAVKKRLAEIKSPSATPTVELSYLVPEWSSNDTSAYGKLPKPCRNTYQYQALQPDHTSLYYGTVGIRSPLMIERIITHGVQWHPRTVTYVTRTGAARRYVFNSLQEVPREYNWPAIENFFQVVAK